MPIATATIQKENIYAKHSSGTIINATDVKDIGGGQYQYTFSRNWVQSDSGTWQIWTSDTHKVLDTNGNGLESKKIAEIQVDIVQTSEYVVVVPWEALTTISELKEAINKRPVLVIKDHYPTDAETDGSWNEWKSEILDGQNVKINFFKFLGGQTSAKLWAEDIVMRWEDMAKYDPVRQTYNISIEGLLIEYNKTPIAVLGNQHFSPPSIVFTYKDANKVFANIDWKAFNLNNTEIGNGGNAAIEGESLTVIRVNPAMAGSESIVVTKVIFEFTRLDGSKLPYEVKL